MNKLTDQSPSTRNKGNTSKVKTRRNLITEKLGKKIIEEFKLGLSSVKL